ncbi:MAG: hypothetical protein QM820_02065 [Minicystis sp.]
MFRYRHADVYQEEDELPWGRVILAFVAVVVIGGVLVAWAWTAQVSLEAKLRPSGTFPEERLGPRHEVGMVQQDLFDDDRSGQQLVEAQRAELDGFGAVDCDAGIVSIPIDEAIELLVEESR